MKKIINRKRCTLNDFKKEGEVNIFRKILKNEDECMNLNVSCRFRKTLMRPTLKDIKNAGN